jgi:hypothetical protein
MSHPQKAFYSKLLSCLNKLLKIVFLFFTLILIVSCHIPNYTCEQKSSFPLTIEKIVVVGFKPALSEEERPSLFRCPLCGATFMAEPVSGDVAEAMTVSLFNCLEKNQKYTLVPPGQAKGVYSTILSQDITIGIKDMLQKTGKSFSSDAVLFGYIYRWTERVGTEYGVESPASVAFDLHLVSTDTGSILWKDSFKKTQLSLSENLLDLSTFIKSRGKWLTAKELAYIGLESMIKCIGDSKTR